MLPSPNPENAVRRLFRENQRRHQATLSERPSESPALFDENIATTIDRHEKAATEMARLRVVSETQQGLLWDQKLELADTRRQIGEALDQAVHYEKLFLSEKVRAELAENRSEQLERQITALRAHLGSLTSAVSRSFDREEPTVPLRIVA